jgi:hypothetical protein
MTRTLKIFGLALGALTAVGAIGSSSAQAAAGELHFDAPQVGTILTAEQVTQLKFTLTASGLVVKCATAKFEGTSLAATTTDVTLTPQFSSCTFGGVAATIDTNGCKYTLSGVASLTADAAITGCEGGKHLTITQGTCELTVPEQSELSHVVFENKNPGAGEGEPMETNTKDLLATVTIQGIHYEGDAGCGINLQGVHTDGDLQGTTTIRAFADDGGVEGEQAGLFGT